MPVKNITTEKQKKHIILPKTRFKMPAWQDCTWRRVACGKSDCPICGPLANNKKKHIEKGENPDDLAAMFEDVQASLKEAKQMLQKQADRLGIDLDKIDNIEEPPKPSQFSLYRQIMDWRNSVYSLIDKKRDLSQDYWLETESASDLFWYANLLPPKVYRQLTNKWHFEHGDLNNNVDFEYTTYVLDESLKIVTQSLEKIYFSAEHRQMELMFLNTQIKPLAEKIRSIKV